MQLRTLVLGLAVTASALPLPSAEPGFCVVNKLIVRCPRDTPPGTDIAKRVAGNILWHGDGPDGLPETKREKETSDSIDIVKRADHSEALIDVA
jgi:hypothetical protein